MKISDVTAEDVMEFLRIDEDEVQSVILTVSMDAATQYIISYTGLTVEEIDDYPDLTVAYLALIQDTYDNRGILSDGKGNNPTITSILNMHTRSNLT